MDGNFRVTHSENDGFKITVNDTVGNSSFSGMLLSYTASGSDTLSEDRNHIGLDIDVDSSASGGNTSEEHRLFGVSSSVKTTGDSDIIYGLYASAEAEISTGQVSSMYGVYGRAESDGAGRQISNTYGVLGTSILNNDASVTQTSAHGIFGKATVSASNAADINNLMGGYFEVQLDEPAAANIPINYIYGNRIEVDINDDGSGNGYDLSSTNSYLLYANYSVVSGGSMLGAYGLYINDTVQNFIRGSLRVDDGAVFNEQGLAASDFRVESDTSSHSIFCRCKSERRCFAFRRNWATPYTQTTGAGQLAYRIDDGSAYGTFIQSNNADNGWSMMYCNKYAYSSGDDRRYIAWYVNGGSLATLQLNAAGTQVEYNTSSDRRLKDSIVDINDGIRLKQLKPRKYQWVGTDFNAEGFIADEADGIVPEAVKGGSTR